MSVAHVLLLALDVALATLAVGAVVDYWRNGSIFATRRAAAEAQADADLAAGRGFTLAGLLACPFCMTAWIAAEAGIYLAAVWGVAALAGDAWAAAARMPLVVLAAARLSWVVDGLLPPRLRYDRGRPPAGGVAQAPGPVVRTPAGLPARLAIGSDDADALLAAIRAWYNRRGSQDELSRAVRRHWPHGHSIDGDALVLDWPPHILIDRPPVARNGGEEAADGPR